MTIDTLDCNACFDDKRRFFISCLLAIVFTIYQYFAVVRNDVLDGVFECFTRSGFGSTEDVVMSTFRDVDDFGRTI